MEERITIFDYLEQVMTIFGVTMVILNAFCFLFGNSAQEYSTMFAFGREGIGTDTMIQFLMSSVCTVALKNLFFTDILIKNMSIVRRTICMVLLEIGMVAVFVLAFGWFPANMWQPWVMFLICFGLCFTVSVTFTIFKERVENQKMEAALKRLKQDENLKR